jgi:hypothetical protein
MYLELIRNSCFMKNRKLKKKKLGLRDKNLRYVSTIIIDCIISIIIQIMLNIHRIDIHIIDCIIFIIIQITLNIHRIVIQIGSYVLKFQVYH